MLDIILIGGLGAPEIIIILVIILLLFGGKKIPELMRGLGRGVKEFKDASNEESKPLSDDEHKPR
jgi:sec-independent protein translocase protein TatA